MAQIGLSTRARSDALSSIKLPARVESDTRRPVMVASHERSGTHLTMDLIRRQFRSFYRRVSPGEASGNLFFSIDRLTSTSHNPCDLSEAEYQIGRSNRTVIKSHATPDFGDVLDEYRDYADELVARCNKIYAVRDGRSVMCSLHLFEQIFSEDARQMTLSEFIRSERDGMNRAAYWANHVRAWMGVSGALVLPFERVVRETEQVLVEIGEHIGAEPLMRGPLLPRRVKTKVELRLRRALGLSGSTTIRGRPVGSEGPKKWYDAFTKDDIEFFDAEAGDVIRALGYPVSAPKQGLVLVA